VIVSAVAFKLILLFAVLVGVLADVGGYTFCYAEGFSYFSTEPKACANCHNMNDEYDSKRMNNQGVRRLSVTQPGETTRVAGR
jgi:hypothetical protein